VILEDFDGKRNYWVLGPMNVTEQSKRPEQSLGSVKRKNRTKRRGSMGEGHRRKICMREWMGYYAGVAGGEAAYD